MVSSKLLTRPRAENTLNGRTRPKLVALVDQQLKAYASAGAVPRTSLHAAFQHWYKKQDLRGFLHPFLPPDALAFDVGANVGQWTAALQSLHCRVVAVEPQEGCAAEITQAHVDHPDVHVVVEAVGAARGTADLFLANTSSEHASMAPEWMSAMRQSGRMPDAAWTAGTVRVPVTTLDLLIERYGCRIS